jgi:hypothetical protein
MHHLANLLSLGNTVGSPFCVTLGTSQNITNPPRTSPCVARPSRRLSFPNDPLRIRLHQHRAIAAQLHKHANP